MKLGGSGDERSIISESLGERGSEMSELMTGEGLDGGRGSIHIREVEHEGGGGGSSIIEHAEVLGRSHQHEPPIGTHGTSWYQHTRNPFGSPFDG